MKSVERIYLKLRGAVRFSTDVAKLVVGPQIPKFDTATQAILKFDTAARHNLKIDMRHAIEATRDLYYLRQTTPALPTQKLINAGYRFFFLGSDFGVGGCAL